MVKRLKHSKKRCIPRDRYGVKVEAILQTPKFDAPVEVRLTEGMGYGVFTTRDITAGELVTNYGGVLRKEKDISKYYDDSDYIIDTLSSTVADGDKTITDPHRCGQLINDLVHIEPTLEEVKDIHSYLILLKLNYLLRMATEPCVNVVMTGKNPKRTTIHAVRDIKMGEQLSLPYGYTYWTSKLVGIYGIGGTEVDPHTPPSSFILDIKEKFKLLNANIIDEGKNIRICDTTVAYPVDPDTGTCVLIRRPK